MNKLKIIGVLLAALFLVGCDRIEVNGSPERVVPTRDDRTFTMTIEVVPEDRINDRCHALGVMYEANGCASFNLITKSCTIYVVAPKTVDDVDHFAVIGHETWHCRFGEWHQ